MLNRIKEAESELADIQRAFAKLTNVQAKDDMAEDIRNRVNAINVMRHQRYHPEVKKNRRFVRVADVASAITTMTVWAPPINLLQPPS